MTFIPVCLARLASFSLIGVALTLAACGGAQEPEKSAASAGNSPALSRSAEGGTAEGPASPQDAAQLAQGARLSSADLQAAELQAQAQDQAKTSETGANDALSDLKPGEIAPKSAYLSGDVARKAAAVRIPAYRFYNGRTGAHFYTVSETERATVASTLSPPFSFEGSAFSVASDHSGGLASVHRFYNTRTGVHFYTISEAERANVATNLPHFAYEGVAYYASPVAGAGLVPLHRFYVMSRGYHFYTASATERDTIIATLGHIYNYEGIGYHVLDASWAARQRVPHTGITSSQCHQAGSDPLVTCGGSATALNPQQDGHRTAVAAMSYSTEPSLFGPYSITSCVRDSVTGLLWEGKTVAGERAGSSTYTNLGNNEATDASGHVNAVNASNLCGHSDWRLPTQMELLTLVDHGRTTAPRLNTTWLVNSAAARYWSGQNSGVSPESWYVNFGTGIAGSSLALSTEPLPVRLVRGGSSPTQRFSYSSVAYGSDAAHNLVNDAWTGLQWRRCEQGRVWSGSTCTGVATLFNHEEALAHARQQSGWRLPNVKELSSLIQLGVRGAATINPVAFPEARNQFQWSSTPFAGSDSSAWGVFFINGQVTPPRRSSSHEIRLVRLSE